MTCLENKVAIITGSTSGIGEGIARLLSSYGVRIVLNSVSSVEKGESLARELGDAIYVQGSIAKEDDCRNIINQAIDKFDCLDILINNAGKSFGVSQNVFDVSNSNFLETLNMNVVGTWCLIREALPHLKQSGDGNIVNITACIGTDPAQVQSGIQYAVAKAAINHLTKLVAKFAGANIRSNAIAPGVVLTERAKKFPEVVEQIRNRIPIKRVGAPEDIAELVIGIIKSNYINGEVIVADGGFSTV